MAVHEDIGRLDVSVKLTRRVKEFKRLETAACNNREKIRATERSAWMQRVVPRLLFSVMFKEKKM